MQICKISRLNQFIMFRPNTYGQTKVATNKTLGMLSVKIMDVIPISR